MKPRIHFNSQHSTPRFIYLALLLCTLLSTTITTTAAATTTTTNTNTNIVVVGSINVDIIIPVHRLPALGETTTSRIPSTETAVGGKGANQAVAAARLVLSSTSPSSSSNNSSTTTMKTPITTNNRSKSRFVCRFGNDNYAQMLETELLKAGVDVSGCSRAPHLPSGQGIVLLDADGTASSIVVGGANTAWPTTTEEFAAHHLVTDAGIVLLQREIPEHVNLAVAKAARALGVPVLLDIGGEDRPLSNELLALIEYIAPNESELQRLTSLPTDTEEAVVAAATTLVKRGARNVLITLAERGSLLVSSSSSSSSEVGKTTITVMKQAAVPVPGGKVVDGTAAGDAFRAAFAVALVEGRPLQQCLEFAAAAGAVAVSKMGAVPSLPSRQEVVELLSVDSDIRIEFESVGSSSGTTTSASNKEEQQHRYEAGSCSSDTSTGECSSNIDSATTASTNNADDKPFPLKFASRLNSMQARRDLINAKSHNKAETTNDVLGWIARQSRIQGLDLVDFNYPQHFPPQPLTKKSTQLKKVTAALAAANLTTGAICIRFPSEFNLGAFTHPGQEMRDKAVAIAVDGCKLAAQLGARELIVWSPYDGYDYWFEAEYQKAWEWTVAAFQQVADACPPGVRVSLEYKPTDESTRFSIVPSTGAALLLSTHINRPNFGLTLDVGHMLMAGENPAQSVAMTAAAGKLFGMQLNDAHVKLGAEDGLMFGAVNPAMALELVYWLNKVGYDGHIYYDTFPRNEDPVREAEYNIRKFKALWTKARQLEAAKIDQFITRHDGMGALELLTKLVAL